MFGCGGGLLIDCDSEDGEVRGLGLLSSSSGVLDDVLFDEAQRRAAELDAGVVECVAGEMVLRRAQGLVGRSLCGPAEAVRTP